MHPLFLHAEKDENEGDEPAHLGDGNRHAKETGQNAGADGVTDHGIGTGGNQLVPLLNGDGAASVSAEVLTRPDRDEEKAGSVLTTGAGRRLCGCAEIRGICDIKEIGSSIQDGRGDCCQATQQRGRCGRGFGRKSP
jgi:hypothetical protein